MKREPDSIINPALSNSPLALLSLRIRNVLTISAALTAACLVGIVWMISSLHSTQEKRVVHLAWQNVQRQQVEQRLESALAIGESVAVAASRDAPESDAASALSLVSTLLGPRLQLDGSVVSLFDREGRIVAATTQQHRGREENQVVSTLLATGKATALLEDDGDDDMVLIALPVNAASQASAYRGVLIEIPARSLLAGISSATESSTLGTRLRQTSARSGNLPLSLPPPLAALGMSLEFIPQAPQSAPGFDPSALVWLLGGIAFGYALLRLARSAANYAVAPICPNPEASSCESGSASPPPAIQPSNFIVGTNKVSTP